LENYVILVDEKVGKAPLYLSKPTIYCLASIISKVHDQSLGPPLDKSLSRR